MKLRILRTWKWELSCSPMEIVHGGTNPKKLVSSDELQYQDELTGYWYPVEVFEEPKPEY